MAELFKYYPMGVYYTPTNGKLLQVKIDSIIARPVEGKVSYLCESGEGWKTFEEPVSFYCSEEDFIENKKAYRKPFLHSTIDDMLHSSCLLDNKFEAWGLNKKLVQRFIFSVHKITLTREGGYDIVCKTKTGEELPKILFPSREDAIDNSIYEIVETDGSRKEVVGWKKSIALTDAQKSVLEEIERKMELLRNMGVVLLYDIDYERLRAVNLMDYDFFSDHDGSDESYFKRIFSGIGEFVSHSDISYIDRCNCISLRKKGNGNEKQ